MFAGGVERGDQPLDALPVPGGCPVDVEEGDDVVGGLVGGGEEPRVVADDDAFGRRALAEPRPVADRCQHPGVGAAGVAAACTAVQGGPERVVAVVGVVPAEDHERREVAGQTHGGQRGQRHLHLIVAA